LPRDLWPEIHVPIIDADPQSEGTKKLVTDLHNI